MSVDKAKKIVVNTTLRGRMQIHATKLHFGLVGDAKAVARVLEDYEPPLPSQLKELKQDIVHYAPIVLQISDTIKEISLQQYHVIEPFERMYAKLLTIEAEAYGAWLLPLLNGRQHNRPLMLVIALEQMARRIGVEVKQDWETFGVTMNF